MEYGLSFFCVQGYFWAYDATAGKCDVRPFSSSAMATFWSAWSWSTEMLLFLLVPLAALIFNVLVINEVRRISNSSPSSAALSRRATGRSSSRSRGSRTLSQRSRSDAPAGATSGSSTATTVMLLSRDDSPAGGTESNDKSRGGGAAAAATSTDSSRSSPRSSTVMLLSVSFYVIATTLPATLVYVLETEFPEGDLTLTDLEIAADPTWTRFLGYKLSRRVVEEICLSHYACNIVLYLLTGAHFRLALLEMFGCRKRRQYSTEYSEVTVRPTNPCTTAL